MQKFLVEPHVHLLTEVFRDFSPFFLVRSESYKCNKEHHLCKYIQKIDYKLQRSHAASNIVNCVGETRRDDPGGGIAGVNVCC